jgi:hypothetical protein
MIADLTAWLWASLQLALPVFALPSFAVAVGCLVAGYVWGHAAGAAKDGMPFRALLRAAMMGSVSGVAVWMAQLVYEAWRVAQ